MSEMERYNRRREIMPPDWRTHREMIRQSYVMRSRVEIAGDMMETANEFIDRVNARSTYARHPLKDVILSSFAYGVAGLMQEYMHG